MGDYNRWMTHRVECNRGIHRDRLSHNSVDFRGSFNRDYRQQDRLCHNLGEFYNGSNDLLLLASRQSNRNTDNLDRRKCGNCMRGAHRSRTNEPRYREFCIAKSFLMTKRRSDNRRRDRGKLDHREYDTGERHYMRQNFSNHYDHRRYWNGCCSSQLIGCNMAYLCWSYNPNLRPFPCR